MVQRTTQTEKSTLIFPSGNTFTLPVPASKESSTELKFSVGSSADTGLHWHEEHTEYFEVLQGIGKLTLEDGNGVLNTQYVDKSSGVVTITPFRRHSLGRGDEGSSVLRNSKVLELSARETTTLEEFEWEKDLLVREWTSPRDGQKEIFFRNLAGVIHDSAKWPFGEWSKGWWIELQLWVIFGAQDNYPAIFRGKWKVFEWSVVHALCWITAALGKVVGLRGSYEEYTPAQLRDGPQTGKND